MKKSTLAMISILIVLFGMFCAVQDAFAVDPPHNGRNSLDMTISCTACHYVASGPTPSWATQPTTTDETFYNNLCTSCHMPSKMTDSRYVVKTHSSQNFSGNYGNWTLECRRCHNPHLQDQVSSYPTDTTANLATGSVVSYIQVPVASFSSTINVSSGLTPDAWIDYILVPNVLYPTKMYHIRSNTADSITVSGAIDGRYAKTGNTYAIRTATMVIGKVQTPNSGLAPVKYFTKDSSKPNSYASSTNPGNVTGICQVCHTQTKSFNRTNVTGSIQEGPNHPQVIATGQQCTTCHKHTEGFKGGCASCHGYPPSSAATLVFMNKSNVTVTSDSGSGPGAHVKHVDSVKLVCANCHANGMLTGAAAGDDKINIGFNWNGDTSGNYDGKSGRTVYPYNTPLVTTGNTYQCSNLYCHSSGQAADGGAGGPVYATPKWNDPASGACGTCHQTKAGAPLGAISSGSHTRHIGAVGVSGCGDCHAGAANDASSYDSTSHLNKDIDVASGYNAAGALGDGYGTCSTASCHADVYGPTTAVTPVWGTTGNGCSACHSIAITANGPATGSHTNTAGHAVACITCHNEGTTMSTSPTNNHADGDIDIANVGYATLNKTKGTAGTTCSTASCHASPVAITTIVTPSWGTTGNGCAACHSGANAITANGPATGSHTNTAGHAVACITCHGDGTTMSTSPTNSHADGDIDIANVGYATLNKTKGTAGTTCSTASCHGSNSPIWGANTGNDTCTKCHGNPTASVTPANYNVIAPPVSTASVTGTLTGVGQVSDNVKVGAHQTHLLYSNGVRTTGLESIQSRCEFCHGSLPTLGTHANGVSTPTWSGLATKGGAMSPTYAGTSCSNTYCHNPAASGGTLLAVNTGASATPGWTDAAYLGDTLRTQANCGVCHKVPGDAGFEPAGTHSGMTIDATNCTGCHGHNGDALSGDEGQRHMDGIKYGGGNCDSCHAYDVSGATYAAGVWSGGTWTHTTASDGIGQGWGAHAKHINHIKTRLSIATVLDPVSQTFGVGTPASVCGTCHTNAGAHDMAGNTTGRLINFGDGSTTYKFGSGNPLYNGSPGTSSSVSPKTCSNISCHFQTTPVWSAY